MSSPVESPKETRRQETMFSRAQYTQDSKYKWKSTNNGNIDMFVMERNERHLTSLQWKWQKSTRSKKRMFEKEKNQKKFSESSHFSFPKEHLSTYSRQNGNLNYAYDPSYEEKLQENRRFMYHPASNDLLYQSYPATPYLTSQHQGRFEYADPWLLKKQNPYYFENDGSVKSSLLRTTNRLLKQQNDTEKQLDDLRRLLKIELDEQDESCVRDERTQQRIDDLEKQIETMGNQLATINHEITQSETDVLSRPVYIIETDQKSEKQSFSIPFNEEDENDQDDDDDDADFYNTRDGSTGYDTLDHVENALEETKLQQEELKNELQSQMQNLKLELEKQLKVQMTLHTEASTITNNDHKMDARVTLLEKQIEEMQKQIKQADEKIAYTETEKKKIIKKRQESAKPKKNEKKVNKECIVNRSFQKDSISSCNRKRLLSKTSSKVSPAPERRSLKDANYEKNEEQNENFEADLQGKHNESISGDEKSNTLKTDLNPCYEPTSSSSSHANLKSKHSNKLNSFGEEQDKKSFISRKERLSTKTTCELENFDDNSIVVEDDKDDLKVESNTKPKEKKSKLDFKNIFNIKSTSFKNKKRRNSFLYGLGSKWCVVHPKVWKYFGSDEDEEIVTRRKCISLILGSILIILFLAIALSIVIGLVGGQSEEKPTEAPLQFVVIAAEGT